MYPKSFLKLLIIGFVLAMLPLLFAFANASIYVDKLAGKSRIAIAQAVQATRASRQIVELIDQMERTTRQYFVLHDESLLNDFKLLHGKFINNLRDLDKLPIVARQQSSLSHIRQDETKLFNEVFSNTSTPSLPDTIADLFADLSLHAQENLHANNTLIDTESSALSKMAEHTQSMLLWQSLTLVPVGLVVALVITYLVAQPIRKIDGSIKRLGEGNFQDKIDIDGPADIQVLGQRLDWLREQLQQVEQEKQRFLRHVSHELKTPLTSIREGSELLSDEIGGPLTPQQKEITQILRDSSIRLQKMIENLLQYTAAQYKKPELKRVKVNMETTIQAVISNYALTLENKNINIQCHIQPIILDGDQEKILTIIDNLFSNALKYTPQNGMIDITMFSRSHQAILKIHDSGPGIASADQSQLFDPFFRGKAAQQTLIGGTGLGLAIAKEYTEAHNGKLTLLPSTSGALFQIELPYENEVQHA